MNSFDLEVLTAMLALVADGEAKRLRVSAGLSLAEVAAACGVLPSTVWRWERGERRPRGRHGLAYARVLDRLTSMEEQ